MNVHPVRATILTALTLACASLALLGLLRPDRWWPVTLGIIAVVAAAMALGRWVRVWLPGPVGLVAVVAYVTAACTPRTAVAWIVPTPAAVRQFGGQLIAAADGLLAQPPLGPDPNVFLPLLLLGFGLATLVAVALAADLGWPAVAGIVAALPWIVLAFIRPDDAFPAAALSTVAFAVLLAAGGSRSGRSDRAGWPAPVVTAGLAVALVVGLAATPAAQRVGWWGGQRDAYLAWTAGLLDRRGDSGVDLGLGLDADLRQNATAVMLRTRAEGADPGLAPGSRGLRLATNYDFDGVRWLAPPTSWQPRDPGVTLWPDTTFFDDGRGPTGLNISVVNFQSADGRVPLTLGPRSAPGIEGLEYDPGTDSARLPGGLPGGWNYRLDTYGFDPALLSTRAVDSATAGDAALAYLNLPHAAEVAEEAAKATEGKTGDYDKAVALVAYFHDGFMYQLDVPAPTTNDAVWEFLQRKSGYCVHYATAFAMMARSLGLPTRVAVGFTAGVARADGSREIRGGDAHAWPEIHFNGVGWVPFEPTPGRDLAGAPAPAPTPEAPVAASPTPETVPSAAPSPSAPDQTTGAETDDGEPAAPRRVTVGLLVGALVVAVAGLGWAWRRRRHRASLERIWQAFQRRALRWGLATPGQTVREVAATLAVRYPLRAAELAELAGLVEQWRYAPSHEAPAAVDARARALRDAIGRARPRRSASEGSSGGGTGQ